MKNSARGVPLRINPHKLIRQPRRPANADIATNVKLTQGGMTAE